MMSAPWILRPLLIGALGAVVGASSTMLFADGRARFPTSSVAFAAGEDDQQRIENRAHRNQRSRGSWSIDDRGGLRQRRPRPRAQLLREPCFRSRARPRRPLRKAAVARGIRFVAIGRTGRVGDCHWRAVGAQMNRDGWGGLRIRPRQNDRRRIKWTTRVQRPAADLGADQSW